MWVEKDTPWVYSLQSLPRYRCIYGNWRSIHPQETSLLPGDHDKLVVVEEVLDILFYFHFLDLLLLLQWFLGRILWGLL